MINITFPDGNVRQYPQGITALEIAKSISNSLEKKVLSAKVNNEVWDATRPINTNASLTLLTWDDKEGKTTFWHSSAHLMAEALQTIYPQVKFTIGPPIDNGFYYDVDFGGEIPKQDDLEAVERLMLKLAAQNNPYQRRNVSKAEALEFYHTNEYKTELINDLADGDITFYTQGNFVDLCRGPHVPHTGYIKAVKLLNIAGAYWRGDENRPQLTRIYGVTFPKQQELDDYLHLLEEAKKRDHRKLGTQLGLFAFSDRVGQGLPLWLPKGTKLREILQDFLRHEQVKRGYKMVMSPHIGKKDLYVTSGHYAKYGKDSFQPIHTPREGEEYFLKPMNCPHHCEIYRTQQYSYRDLPLRLGEFGTVYRYEQSGELNGLLRVRGFTQDDAHIFCAQEQLKDEFKNVIDLVTLVFGKLGFKEFTAQISLRDQEDRTKYIGSEENWEKAENAIIEAAQEKGLKTVIEYGEAAFYGPKLDFMVKDALGRSWQLGTIQVDYNLPERFDLEYIGADNQRRRPVMIHRAPFGSFERFIAVLIENCAGNFPMWLAPQQIAILPISEKFTEYAEKVQRELTAHGFRAEIDYRNEKIGRKIRDAAMQKIPCQLIIGEKEAEEGMVSVRRQVEGDKGAMTLLQLVDMLNLEMEG
ncbi:threonine--tRNA ligase [Sphingobacteriales bacterium UPWRP_1]|nr:threonine--tRNA ligase [Sphingobacteriales bacterium TSM_CSM]PSJ78843.1 threonine--tRNA ligase [Sphingobacteriales bacterium UPWRP_1]